jgi:putative membrane protein
MIARRLALALTLTAAPALAAPPAPPPPTPEFLHQTAAANAFIRQAGVLTQDHAKGVDVRVYADEAIGDYARAIGNMKAAAGSEGIRSIDSTLTPDQEQMLSDLEAADPKVFDKAFIKAEVKVQEQALAMIQAYAKHGDDPIIRQAAAAMAEILQPTLNDARVTESHVR